MNLLRSAAPQASEPTPMRFCILLPLMLLPSLLGAQPPTEKTIRDVALDVGMNVTRLEMAACRTAHPAHADAFSASLDTVSEKLEQALEDMKAQRAEDLATVVPAALLMGQDMVSALHNSDNTPRELDVCLRNAREILHVTDQEAAGLMGQLVTNLVRASAEYRSEMERVLR